MVNPTPQNDDDFYARAMASFHQQMDIANTNTNNNDEPLIDVEEYAKSLVEDDLPKIDAAVKSYLSLVAARSAVASDIDVLSTSAPTDVVQCTFATTTKSSSMDANRYALLCARVLLTTINSTNVPTEELSTIPPTTSDNDETKSAKDEDMKLQLQNNTTKILWNRLVKSSASSTGDKSKQMKPSKVLGRTSLLVAYPYIQERFRRGILLNESDGNDTPAADESKTNPLRSLSNDLLQPVSPPKGIDIDQWKAFYTEFGQLLSRACGNHNDDQSKQHDDSALLWSSDKGVAELQSRRESRVQRASQALASVDDVKTEIADSLKVSSSSDADKTDSSNGES
jgi:hypothetical protein